MANIWYIQVNRYCNNKCHFCSNPSNGNSIWYDEWKKLIDDFVDSWYQWIIFTWWEPTLSINLDKWISYALDKWIDSRIISNWMKCSDYDYVLSLKKAWLQLIHFSLYSHKEEIHDFLTDTPWSYKKLLEAIQNALKLWIRVQINCVINRYNQAHLDKIAKFVAKCFPQINHFVWNNLDPEMLRDTKIAKSMLPNFDKVSESLREALRFLEKQNKTFRVEKLPICFMEWYEWASTETRKIVKNEERTVHFLDFRWTIIDEKNDFYHSKPKVCDSCNLNKICAWVCDHNDFYKDIPLKPISDYWPHKIIEKIIK